MYQKLFLALLVTLITLTSCHDDDSSGPAPVSQPVQTVLWFTPYVPTLKSFINQNYRDILLNIEENRGLRNIRFLIFSSTTPATGELTEVMWYNDSIYTERRATYSDFTPTKAEHLATILNDVKRIAPSATGRYGLMVGGHGMGWITVEDFYDTASARGTDDELETSASSLHPFFGGDATNTCINIEELRQAIEKTNMYMDFILFDDCYMAQVEVAYELRNATKFLLGSTCEIMNYGLPYALLFSDLVGETPAYASFMQKFYNFYSDYYRPCGTFSAIDCREVEATAELMRSINANFQLSEDSLSVLQYYDGFSQKLFFDMGDYVAKLCPETSFNTQMQAQLEKLVPYKTATASFYSKYNGRITSIKRFSGISISDPSKNKYTQGKTNTSWWKATHEVQ